MRYGYTRVSTATGEQLSALKAQRQRLQNAGVDTLLEDVQSGLDNYRPGYLKLLDAIGKGLCSEVVVTRLDRLGRDASETDGFLAFAAKHSCRVFALDGGVIESETPTGFLLSRVMTSLAEMESRVLSQRVRAGLKVRREQGAPIRARAPWGYRKSADGRHLEADPEEWPRAKRMLQLLKENGWRLKTALREWRKQGLGRVPLAGASPFGRWLRNPILRGGMGYHYSGGKFKDVRWGLHPALLDQSTYEIAEAAIASNRSYWGKQSRREPNLLVGLCHCGHCGSRMHYGGPDRLPCLLCRGDECPYEYKATKEKVIIQAINEALRERASDMAQLVATEPPQVVHLREEIARLEAFHDPDLADAISAKRARMQNLHKSPPPDGELLKHLREKRFWAVYSRQELRELYLLLVERVVIEHRQVAQVVFRF